MGIDYRLFCSDCSTYNDIDFRYSGITLAAQNSPRATDIITDVLEFMIYHCINRSHEIFISDDDIRWSSDGYEHYTLCKKYKNCLDKVEKVMENPNFLATLKKLLIADEGSRRYPYKDALGNTTIGVGRNLSSNGLSEDEINDLLNNDINSTISFISNNFPFYNSLDDVSKMVIIDVCFNVGATQFLGFKKFMDALSKGDKATASTELLNSKAAIQTGDRYKRLAKMLLDNSIALI